MHAIDKLWTISVDTRVHNKSISFQASLAPTEGVTSLGSPIFQ